LSRIWKRHGSYFPPRFMQEDRYVLSLTLKLARKCKLNSFEQLCDGGYYQIFNNPNVEMVHVRENPIYRVYTNWDQNL
jgi:hypothetical protein